MARIKRTQFDTVLPDQASAAVDWAVLAALASLVRVDATTGAVSVRNGESSITLHADGTVRIDARRIVNCAGEDIVLSAARIDLN
jgi:hypothetical protein